MRACLDGTVPEESVTVVWASRSARDRATPWRIGKRGTLFARAPDPAVVDIYKDVTHLYRRKRSGKNRDRTEWGTTLWIEGAKTQILQTPAQEAALTRLHYQRCGYFSIQWGPVELRNNRVLNPEQNLRYPLVSEDLWNKHLGSKRSPARDPEPMTTPDGAPARSPEKVSRNEGDDACVRLAGMYATKLSEEAIVDGLLAAAREVMCTTGVVAPRDARFDRVGALANKDKKKSVVKPLRRS